MSLGKIIKALESTKLSSPAVIAEVLDEAVFDRQWLQAHFPDPAPKTTYGRDTLYCGRDFEVVLATWPAGVSTLVHDHGRSGSLGLAKVLVGDIFNHVYRRDQNGQVKLVSKDVVSAGSTIAVPPGLLHTMGNHRDDGYAVSIHIYAPKIVDVSYWDPDSLEPVSCADQADDVSRVLSADKRLEQAVSS